MALINAEASCFMLGVSFSNMHMSEVVEQAVDYMQKEENRQHPAYLATVNMDFLVKALFWKLTCPGYPGLLHALRACRWAVADGMPVVWLSALLGCPLKERIAGSDLVPAILERCQHAHKKVFLLGGQGDSAVKAAEKLMEKYPGLKIVGTHSPFIPQDGKCLTEGNAIDAAVVNLINASEADFLLIALGNPKQEIWFRRIQKKLRVPLSIGVGGVFQFFSGNVLRAPMWMRRNGLEWLHRLIQEPSRLWKRYLLGSIKFTCLAVPLLLFHYINKCASSLMEVCSSKNDPAINLSPLYAFNTGFSRVSILCLSAGLNSKACAKLEAYRESFLMSDICLVDFSAVKQLDAAGLGWLFNLWQEAESRGLRIRCFSMSLDVKIGTYLYGIADTLCAYLSPNIAYILAQEFQGKAAFLCEQVVVCGDTVVFTYFGEFNDLQDYDLQLATIQLHSHKCTHCLLNMRFCTALETAGSMFLLAAKKQVQSLGKSFALKGCSPELCQTLQCLGIGESL